MNNSKLLPLCAAFKSLFNKFPSERQYPKIYEAANNPTKSEAIEYLLNNYLKIDKELSKILIKFIMKEEDDYIFQRFFKRFKTW